MVGSMGQVGSAGDNAAMESFFALLQRNVLDRQRWATRDQLRLAIVTWIERTYHRRRRQAALGRLTPIEYETIIGPAATTGGLTPHPTCHPITRQSRPCTAHADPHTRPDPAHFRCALKPPVGATSSQTHLSRLTINS
jgi:hypothetical protein